MKEGLGTEPAVQRRAYELMALMQAADERLAKLFHGELQCGVSRLPRARRPSGAARGVSLRPDDLRRRPTAGCTINIGKGVPLVEIFGEMLGRQVGGVAEGRHHAHRPAGVRSRHVDRDCGGGGLRSRSGWLWRRSVKARIGSRS